MSLTRRCLPQMTVALAPASGPALDFRFQISDFRFQISDAVFTVIGMTACDACRRRRRSERHRVALGVKSRSDRCGHQRTSGHWPTVFGDGRVGRTSCVRGWAVQFSTRGLQSPVKPCVTAASTKKPSLARKPNCWQSGPKVGSHVLCTSLVFVMLVEHFIAHGRWRLYLCRSHSCGLQVQPICQLVPPLHLFIRVRPLSAKTTPSKTAALRPAGGAIPKRRPSTKTAVVPAAPGRSKVPLNPSLVGVQIFQPPSVDSPTCSGIARDAIEGAGGSSQVPKYQACA